MMDVSLVFAVIGPDRPGLVELLSATVAEHEGNWLDSRMSELSGQFAGVVLVTVPAREADPLRQALLDLEDRGLRVMVESAPSEGPLRVYRSLRLEVVGQDHPGIVRDISRVLRARGVSIVELETYRSTGAMSAEAMFKLQAEIAVPDDIGVERILRDLEALAGDIMVEVEVSETNDGHC